MKRGLLVFSFLLFTSLSLSPIVNGQDVSLDTVYTGIYITSIHDIDFKQKEYTVDCWLWLTYKNKEFDFEHNLEVPEAKSFVKSYTTVDSSGGQVFMIMKLQCVMNNSWRITNFPFDRQSLRLTLENSQYDTRNLVFALDTAGKHFDPKFTLNGWNIDSFSITKGVKEYETAFGDTTLDKPHSEYSAFKVKIGIKRNALGLFWKIFLGMYVAFFIAYICFFIHTSSVDSRFGLGVGSLFSAIGNKYIIDSSLPETTSFTLVDILHGITLLFIFITITSSVYAVKLVKENKIKETNRFDRIMAFVVLIAYIILNTWFILNASKS
jgi:hypothetical protein